MTVFAAIDAFVNVLILAGFAAADTIPFLVPLIIFAIALVCEVVFLSGIASGFTKRFRDPSLTWAQLLAVCGANLLALLMAPQIAYMFIVNLFVSLSFGSLYFNRRQFQITWALLSLALGVSLWVVRDRIGIAHSSFAEWLLLCLVIMLALARFLKINAEISRLRMSLQEKNRELVRLASRDDLTGLWNRREFMRLLQEHAAGAERHGVGFMIAVLDVDHFKRVNDRFGHVVGDAVLKELAMQLDSTRRATDILARYGGEEFVLLLPAADAHAAEITLERMRARLPLHDWSTIAHDLRVTISAGIAAKRSGESILQLLSRADAALYQAKNAGRNCIRVAATNVTADTNASTVRGTDAQRPPSQESLHRPLPASGTGV
jgi:diguanylate cyclase